MARLHDVVKEPFDLEAMARFVELAPTVTFRSAWNGYDRVQVDSFRAELEQELHAAWVEALRRAEGGLRGRSRPASQRLGGHNVRDMRFPRVMRGYDTAEVDTYLDCAGAVLTYLSAR